MEGEPHKLHRTWTLTFKSPHKSRRMPDSRGWLNTVKPVAVITTVEELWGVVDAVRPPSRLAQNGDYCLFDAKCAPTWEDVHNAQGGKWSASFTRDEAAAFDAAWEQLVMAAVGEQWDSDALCGLVASARRTEFRLAVWTTDARDTEGNACFGETLQEVAGRAPSYSPHFA